MILKVGEVVNQIGGLDGKVIVGIGQWREHHTEYVCITVNTDGYGSTARVYSQERSLLLVLFLLPKYVSFGVGCGCACLHWMGWWGEEEQAGMTKGKEGNCTTQHDT